jgi:hypothetical protein
MWTKKVCSKCRNNGEIYKKKHGISAILDLKRKKRLCDI